MLVSILLKYQFHKNIKIVSAGYETVAEWWLSYYEADDSEEQFADLWKQIKPLYQQLHAYVRRHLREKYGENVVSARGPIPAHLLGKEHFIIHFIIFHVTLTNTAVFLGNIWAQTWNNVEKFTRPYPDKPDIDITAALIAQVILLALVLKL